MAELRIPLAQKLTNRTASLAKDSYSANCYFETRGQVRKVFKRPGLSVFPTTGDTVAPGTSQGMTVFSGNLVYVINNNVYSTTAYGVTTKIGTISSSATGTGAVNTKPVNAVSVNAGLAGTALNRVFFTQTANSAYLFFHNNANAYYITNSSNTLHSVTTNVSNMVAGAVYLDGYCFVMGTDAKIYNSNLEDPTTWSSLNFLTAQSDPDGGTAIVRQLNYLVAFGEWSTEFFYNANNATGSPLSPQQSLKLEIGCADGNSVAKIDQSVIWVGKSRLHGRAVYLLDNGTSPTCISTPAVERFLNGYPASYMYAYTFRISGHVFYVLSIKDAGHTFVYDLNESEWYVWSTTEGGVEMIFDPGFYAEFNGAYFTLCKDDGRLYILSTTSYSDVSDQIYFRIVTELVDNGTTNRKFFKRAELVGDKVTANAVLSNTNNDYKSWSQGRTINLNNSRAQLHNLGTGRRRAWQVLITDNVPICLESLEVEYDVGHLEEGQ